VTPLLRIGPAWVTMIWILGATEACDTLSGSGAAGQSTDGQSTDGQSTELLPVKGSAPTASQAPPGPLSSTSKATATQAPDLSPFTTLEPMTPTLPGPFIGTTGAGQRFVVTLATKGSPRPYRRPLAFYRLAQALAYDQVPVTELRRLGTGEVSQLLRSHPVAQQYLAGRATVANDGTIAALLVSRVPGVEANLADHERLARCARLAASIDPLPPAEATYVSDYVKLLVLDYLAANVQRRTLSIDEHARRIRAIDNGTAFPGYVAPEALDIPLGRLEPLVRFPRDLKTQLGRLDRDSVKQQLVRGRFEDQLLGPRQLTGLAERRATLLTLLESRLLQYGEKVVLSL
jgi:hypothetical protein